MAQRPIGVREQVALRGSNDLPRQGGQAGGAQGRAPAGQQGAPVSSAQGQTQIAPVPTAAVANGLAQQPMAQRILQPALQQNDQMQALLANPNTLPVLSQQAAMANFLTPNVALPTPPTAAAAGQTRIGTPQTQGRQPAGAVVNTNPLSRLIRGG